MDQLIIDNYNRVVKDNDIVIWLGDIAFKGKEATEELVNTLPGYKILIVGNHDFKRNNCVIKPAASVQELHLSKVIFCYREVFPFQLLLTHYPLLDTPYAAVNLHGHLHNSKDYDPRCVGKYINLSVEQTGYTPINLKEVGDRAYKML